MDNTSYVHLNTKIAAIKATDWNYEFDPDAIFKIDPYNIFGEIITIPVLVNRMGVIVAEMRSYVKEEKINLDIKEAKVRQLFRQKFDKKPTVQETEDHLSLDSQIRNLRLKLISLQQDLEKLESMYEAAKDKSFKLNSLSKGLTPGDFEKELIDGKINGVLIKIRDKKYKTN